jgi:hypothetical protein
LRPARERDRAAQIPCNGLPRALGVAAQRSCAGAPPLLRLSQIADIHTFR